MTKQTKHFSRNDFAGFALRDLNLPTFMFMPNPINILFVKLIWSKFTQFVWVSFKWSSQRVEPPSKAFNIELAMTDQNANSRNDKKLPNIDFFRLSLVELGLLDVEIKAQNRFSPLFSITWRIFDFWAFFGWSRTKIFSPIICLP